MDADSQRILRLDLSGIPGEDSRWFRVVDSTGTWYRIRFDSTN